MAYVDFTFGDYRASYTTEKDIPGVVALMESKNKVENQSKRDAVYRRLDNILFPAIEEGRGFKIERLALTDEEATALGGESKIIGFTGGYLLGMDEHGLLARVPTELSKNLKNRRHALAEIGSTFLNPALDLPNASGNRPSRWAYRLLVAGAEMGMFNLAGKEVGGKRADFEAMIASVQNRDEMRAISNWLQSPPLAWEMIERPSDELKALSAGTTTDIQNYNDREKIFYSLSPSKLPAAAKYMLDCYSTGRLVSDHVYEQNIANISLELDPEMLKFIQVVANSEEYFAANADSGMTDVRRRLYIPQSVTPILPANLDPAGIRGAQRTPPHDRRAVNTPGELARVRLG